MTYPKCYEQKQYMYLYVHMWHLHQFVGMLLKAMNAKLRMVVIRSFTYLYRFFDLDLTLLVLFLQVWVYFYDRHHSAPKVYALADEKVSTLISTTEWYGTVYFFFYSSVWNGSVCLISRRHHLLIHACKLMYFGGCTLTPTGSWEGGCYCVDFMRSEALEPQA